VIRRLEKIKIALISSELQKLTSKQPKETIHSYKKQQLINTSGTLLSTLEGEPMPQRVICHGCNNVLYEGAELRPPDEIIHQHDGKCPKCGKKLSLLPIGVEVKPHR
jgi:hypothetical protein